MEADLYDLTEAKRYETDPGFYNFGYSIDLLISQEIAPPEVRLRNIVGRLRAAPRFLAQGRDLLKRPPCCRGAGCARTGWARSPAASPPP
jgi:hypothetical protein